ncbi:MAG: hypothetical protein H6739_34280 [Alphaproteobacteria bacterium]|nr:hypothetical protein [Alphaproteobacteria bacterium]
MAPLLLTLTLAVPPLIGTANAAEVVWDGQYRARGLAYNSLSLVTPTNNENSLGWSSYMDHRFRLQPILRVNSQVSAFLQVDFLPLTPWGGTINTWTDPVTGDAIAMAYADGVSPYADPDDGTSYLRNLSLTRAWVDVWTPAGKLRVGRVPMHWGAGILLNDGLDPLAEFGDTSDRVQFTSKVGPVYLMGGWEVMNEGYIGLRDDMQALDFAIAYRAETMSLGLLNRYRFQPDTFNGYTADLWGFAELGMVKVETELVGVFGAGNLDNGANDVRIATFGGMIRAIGELEKLYGGLEIGYANGDKDPDDDLIYTYTFDRDHNIALILFEEPLPVMAAAVPNDANQGLDYSAVRTGEGIRNAIYFTPHVGYKLRPDLSGQVALIGARAALVPAEDEERKGYGWEVDATVSWQPNEHFSLSGTGGLLLPGPYYSAYTHDDLGGNFGDPTFAGRVLATVDF